MRTPRTPTHLFIARSLRPLAVVLLLLGVLGAAGSLLTGGHRGLATQPAQAAARQGRVSVAPDGEDDRSRAGIAEDRIPPDVATGDSDRVGASIAAYER
jgi:hypothetical protein